ncbi:hypothetical protein [Brassicibacter mesophilus]|uniref:hypothetical protein n=1 Tax=Brassicibacter mesophilus TaxID=745119 RepID=UPI003D244E5A
MRYKRIAIFILLIISFVVVGYFKITNNRDLTFSSINEAEQVIGQIKLPKIEEEYSIYTIKYHDDNFTTPVLRVYFRNNEGKEIIFMTTSNISTSFVDFERVKNKNILNMIWIRKHAIDFEGFEGNYILQWRKSTQQSYEYFVTQNYEDKQWLVQIAENY